MNRGNVTYKIISKIFLFEIIATAKERTSPGTVYLNDAEEFAFTGEEELGFNDVQCALDELYTKF